MQLGSRPGVSQSEEISRKAFEADPSLEGTRAQLALPVYVDGGRVRWCAREMRYEAQHSASKEERSVVPRIVGCEEKACRDAAQIADTPGTTLVPTVGAKRSKKTCVTCYLEHVACKQSLIDAQRVRVRTGEWGPIRHRRDGRGTGTLGS